MSRTGIGNSVSRWVDRIAGAGVTDRELLHRYTEYADQDAFEVLVRRHHDLVLAASARVLADPNDVADAIQATFLVLVQRAHRADWRPNLGPWLYGVAHRVSVRLRVRSRRRPVPLGTADPVAPPVGPDLSWQEACALLHAELDLLPDRYRLPLLLCYLEGETRETAAAALGVTCGVIKGRVRRGCEVLRVRLARRGVTFSVGILAAVTTPRILRAEGPEMILSALKSGCSLHVSQLAQEIMMSSVMSKVTKCILAGVLLAGTTAALVATTGDPPGSSAPTEKKAVKEPAVGAQKGDVWLPAPLVAAEPKYKPIDPATVAVYEKLGAKYSTLKVDEHGYVIYGAVDGLPGFTFEQRLPDEKLPPVGVPFYLACLKATDGELKALNNLINLTHLELPHKQVTDVGLKELKGLNDLRWLSLWDTKVTDEGLKELRELHNLESLDLGYTAVTDEGMKELKELKNLTRLSLGDTKVTDVGLKELQGLKNLKSLLLINLGVTDAGLKELKGLNKLTILHLYGTAVTDAGMRELRELKDLSILELSKTKVGDAGLRELKDLKSLDYLGLVGTQVTNGGMNELKSIASLTQLSLGETVIGDSSLIELRDLKNLTYLDLHDTKVTDEGLKELKNLKNLKNLAIYGVAVSKAGIKELQEALPKCSIQTVRPGGGSKIGFRDFCRFLNATI
jgi:RNA polymerase sigma factor (sigma-70 family)